jgi:hypothetical protein
MVRSAWDAPKVNDSWSSEDPAGSAGPAEAGGTPPGEATDAPARRSDRYGVAESTQPEGRRERHPWIGLAFLLAGLAVGGAGLAMIALDLDRPGVAEIEPERWWLVVGGGVAIAWSSPWFLRPHARRRMAIVLAVCTAAVLIVAAVAIGDLSS